MSMLVEQLRSQILDRHESPTEISRWAEVDKSQMSRLVSRQRVPTIATIERLAEAMGYEIVLRPKGAA